MKSIFNLLLPVLLLAFACQNSSEKKLMAPGGKTVVPEGVTFKKETLKDWLQGRQLVPHLGS